VNRTIHVTSLGGGRVVDLRVKLGDFVKKGETLLAISSPDLGAAFADYQKALADERNAKKGLDREQLLFDRGAVAEKTCRSRRTPRKRRGWTLRRRNSGYGYWAGPAAAERPAGASGAGFGNDRRTECSWIRGSQGHRQHSQPVHDSRPVRKSGWSVTFSRTIWAKVHLGDAAEIRLNAFPERTFKGIVADISRVLDPGRDRQGAYLCSGTARGCCGQACMRSRPSARASCGRAWWCRLRRSCACTTRIGSSAKEGPNRFRRVEVEVNGATSDGMQEITGGSEGGGGSGAERARLLRRRWRRRKE